MSAESPSCVSDCLPVVLHAVVSNVAGLLCCGTEDRAEELQTHACPGICWLYSLALQPDSVHSMLLQIIGHHPHLLCPQRPTVLAGATPTDCGSTPEGGEILIPFTATIACYACK